MTDKEKRLCDILKLLRISSGMTIKELSEYTGMSCNTINGVEHLKMRPSLRIIEKYGIAVKVNSSQILHLAEVTNASEWDQVDHCKRIALMMQQLFPANAE